jgi:hypothetical protein
MMHIERGATGGSASCPGSVQPISARIGQLS